MTELSKAAFRSMDSASKCYAIMIKASEIEEMKQLFTEADQKYADRLYKRLLEMVYD